MANKKSKKKNSDKKNNNQKNVRKNDALEKNTGKKTEDKDIIITSQAKGLNKKESSEKKEVIDKAKKNLVYAESSNDEISKLIKIVLIVTAIMVVFYFVTSLVTKRANAKKLTQDKTTEKAEIQYEEIIIGSMLNKDGEYYVLIYDENDNNFSEYQTMIQTLAVTEDAPKIYKSSLSDGFNKAYLAKRVIMILI